MGSTSLDEAPQFVLRQPVDFWWDVKVPVPHEGEYRFLRFEALFAALPQDELDRMRGIGLAQDDQRLTDEQIARRVLRGWRHVNDEQGQPLPFTADNVSRLLQWPLARTAVVATYLAATSGLAARKNA